jgi:hypothetical protein
MHAKRNTPGGDRLDLLVTLVEAWEAKRYLLELPGGDERLRFAGTPSTHPAPLRGEGGDRGSCQSSKPRIS